MIYVGEWVVFFYFLLCVVVFNMIYFTNIILVDMPWEERITLAFIKLLVIILGLGIGCFLYIKYLTGNSTYRMIKEVIWGMLFGANTLSCILWLRLSYPFDLSNNDRILLILAIIVCAILTVQVIIKFLYEIKG